MPCSISLLLILFFTTFISTHSLTTQLDALQDDQDIVSLSSYSFSLPNYDLDNKIKFRGYFRNPFYHTISTDSLYFKLNMQIDTIHRLPVWTRIILFNPISFEIIASISDRHMIGSPRLKINQKDILEHQYLVVVAELELHNNPLAILPNMVIKFDSIEQDSDNEGPSGLYSPQHQQQNQQDHFDTIHHFPLPLNLHNLHNLTDPTNNHNQPAYLSEPQTNAGFTPSGSSSSLHPSQIAVSHGLFHSFPTLLDSTQTGIANDAFDTTLSSFESQNFIGPSILPYPSSPNLNSLIPPITTIEPHHRFLSWQTTIPALSDFPPIPTQDYDDRDDDVTILPKQYITIISAGYHGFLLNQTLVDNPARGNQRIQPIECTLNGISTSLFSRTKPASQDPIDISLATLDIPEHKIIIHFTPFLYSMLFPSQISSLTISCPSVLLLSTNSPDAGVLPIYNQIIAYVYTTDLTPPTTYPRNSFTFTTTHDLWKFSTLPNPLTIRQLLPPQSQSVATPTTTSLLSTSPTSQQSTQTTIFNSRLITPHFESNQDVYQPITTSTSHLRNDVSRPLLIPLSAVQPMSEMNYFTNAASTDIPYVSASFYFEIQANIDPTTLSTRTQTDYLSFQVFDTYFPLGSKQSPVYFTITESRSTTDPQEQPPITFHGLLQWKDSEQTQDWEIPAALYATDFRKNPSATSSPNSNLILKTKRFHVTIIHQLSKPLLHETQNQMRLVLLSFTTATEPINTLPSSSQTLSITNSHPLDHITTTTTTTTKNNDSKPTPTSLPNEKTKTHRTRTYIPTFLPTSATIAYITQQQYDVQLLSTSNIKFRLSTTTNSVTTRNLDFATLSTIHLSITGRWAFDFGNKSADSISISLLCNDLEEAECLSANITYLSYNMIEISMVPKSLKKRLQQIDFTISIKYTSTPFLSTTDLPYDSSTTANLDHDPIVLTITPQFTSQPTKVNTSPSDNTATLNDQSKLNAPILYTPHQPSAFLYYANSTILPRTALGFPVPYSVIDHSNAALLVILMVLGSIIGIILLIVLLVCLTRYFRVQTNVLSRLRRRHQVKQQEDRHNLLGQVHIEQLQAEDGVQYTVVPGSILPPAYDFMEDDAKPDENIELLNMNDKKKRTKTRRTLTTTPTSPDELNQTGKEKDTYGGLLSSLLSSLTSPFVSTSSKKSQSKDPVLLVSSAEFFHDSDEEQDQIDAPTQSVPSDQYTPED